MPPELPTTVIGLLAFVIFILAGVIAWVLKNNQNAVSVFMKYIEEKNHNLERATENFLSTLEERDLKFTDGLVKQGERHQQAMDDLAARLEASLSSKTV